MTTVTIAAPLHHRRHRVAPWWRCELTRPRPFAVVVGVGVVEFAVAAYGVIR